jgi:hypothetical protein
MLFPARRPIFGERSQMVAKKLTITVPDDAYASLQSVAKAAHCAPEELATQAVLEHLGALIQQGERPQPAADQGGRDAALAVMRQRGHLVEPRPIPHHAGGGALPPTGSLPRARLDEEVAAALGDALIQSGLSVLDLIERR